MVKLSCCNALAQVVFRIERRYCVSLGFRAYGSPVRDLVADISPHPYDHRVLLCHGIIFFLLVKLI